MTRLIEGVLAVVIAVLLAGGCASAGSHEGWRPRGNAVTVLHFDECLALAGAHGLANGVDKADEDALKACMKGKGHGRAVSPAVVTAAKIIGGVILAPILLVVCVLDPVGCAGKLRELVDRQ